MKRAFLFFVLALDPLARAHAEVKWLSRANCELVNESVTYDRPQFNYYWMITESDHVGLGAASGHHISSSRSLVLTWRSYAGDFADAATNNVIGRHWFGTDEQLLFYRSSRAYDCNLSEW